MKITIAKGLLKGAIVANLLMVAVYFSVTKELLLLDQEYSETDVIYTEAKFLQTLDMKGGSGSSYVEIYDIDQNRTLKLLWGEWWLKIDRDSAFSLAYLYAQRTRAVWVEQNGIELLTLADGLRLTNNKVQFNKNLFITMLVSVPIIVILYLMLLVFERKNK